jgi:hypothetical protein
MGLYDEMEAGGEATTGARSRTIPHQLLGGSGELAGQNGYCRPGTYHPWATSMLGGAFAHCTFSAQSVADVNKRINERR